MAGKWCGDAEVLERSLRVPAERERATAMAGQFCMAAVLNPRTCSPRKLKEKMRPKLVHLVQLNICGYICVLPEREGFAETPLPTTYDSPRATNLLSTEQSGAQIKQSSGRLQTFKSLNTIF